MGCITNTFTQTVNDRMYKASNYITFFLLASGYTQFKF